MSKHRASGRRFGLGALLLVGAMALLAGLVAAWEIWPVQWVDTDPADLRLAHQKDYVLMLADSYALDGDVRLAQERLQQLSPDGSDLSAVQTLVESVIAEQEAGGDAEEAARVASLYQDTGLVSIEPAAVEVPADSLPTWVVIIFASGVGILALAAVAGMMLARASKKAEDEPELPVFREGLTPLDEESPDLTPGESVSAEPDHKPSLEEILGIQQGLAALPRKAPEPEAVVGPEQATIVEATVGAEEPEEEEEDGDEFDDVVDPWASAEVETEEEVEAEPVAEPAPAPPPAEAAETGAAPAVSRETPESLTLPKPLLLTAFDVAYRHGDDDFYHSVTIDTPDESFVGQCGIVISDVLGADDAQLVDAFDIWLFETHGTRTVSKVLLSPWAAADESIVTRLSRKGEIRVVEPEQQVVLQTMTLRLTAEVKQLAFRPDQDHPEGIFQELGLHVRVEQLAH